MKPFTVNVDFLGFENGDAYIYHVVRTSDERQIAAKCPNLTFAQLVAVLLNTTSEAMDVKGA